jgi:hypothetical protein
VFATARAAGRALRVAGSEPFVDRNERWRRAGDRATNPPRFQSNFANRNLSALLIMLADDLRLT